MSLRVLATSLLLISGAYASTSHHHAGHHATSSHTAAEKPDHSTLTGKAEGGLVKKCTAECEGITEKHFMEVYGGICSADEDNLDGQRILARMEEYDEAMKKKDIKYDDEIDPKKKSKVLKYKKAEERGSGCDEPHLRKISRFDMLNNSLKFTSKDKEKKKLNGVLAKGEKMDPFAYGMQCVAQCRDPEGKTSGRDMDAEQIYVKPGANAAEDSKEVSVDATGGGEKEKDAPEVSATGPAPEEAGA